MASRFADQENGVDDNDIHWDRELPEEWKLKVHLGYVKFEMSKGHPSNAGTQ